MSLTEFGIISISDLGHFNTCWKYLIVALIYSLLMMYDIDNLFMSVLVICVSSLVCCLFIYILFSMLVFLLRFKYLLII
jgi:hypothetical protein